MTWNLFSLLTVTTHALHLVTLIKPSSSLKVTHRSFRHASPHLWNQLPTSLGIPHPNYSSPSQQPSFEHAGLTCYTLPSPSTTFSLFHSLTLWAQYLPIQKILSSTLVCFCLSGWSHGSRPSSDLFAHRFYAFSSIFSVFCFSYSYVRQTLGQLSGQLLGALLNSLIDWWRIIELSLFR